MCLHTIKAHSCAPNVQALARQPVRSKSVCLTVYYGTHSDTYIYYTILKRARALRYKLCYAYARRAEHASEHKDAMFTRALPASIHEYACIAYIKIHTLPYILQYNARLIHRGGHGLVRVLCEREKVNY